jgi:glutathione S-transferase
MKLVLYYAPGACAMIPYINLTEAGADFEVRTVNIGKSENRTPEYNKLNPMQKVPVLMIDGEPLTENVAIQIFIARTFPHARLLPEKSFEEIKAISLMAWCASGIHPHLSRVGRPDKFCDMPGSADSVRNLAAEQLHLVFKIADDRLKGRELFFDAYTVCDAYFFWCFRRATQFKLPLSDFENCNAHFTRMQQRPSVQKLLAFEADVLKSFANAA